MDTTEVRFERINFDDETFRISEDLDPAPLEESLREVGQLNPVILLDREGSAGIIVCGFRRLRALKRMGADRCLARYLPADRCAPLAALRIALWDNLAHRRLDPLEKARVLNALKNSCGVGQDRLVDSYLKPLGLAPHKNVLKTYLGLHDLDRDLKRLLGEDLITVASAERLAGMTRETQAAIATVLGAARFSASLQRQLLDLIEDVAAIEGRAAGEITKAPEILQAANDASRSPYQRGEAIYTILYRRRNPRLSRAQERFLDGRRRLELPGSVRVTPDPFFERPRIRVEFEAPSAESFREIAGALDRAGRTGDLAQLFEVE
jgi:ParB-like chromosome segregation protein Spo0J